MNAYELVNVLEYFKEINLNEALRAHALAGVILDGRAANGGKKEKAAAKAQQKEPEAHGDPVVTKRRRRRRTKKEMEAARRGESNPIVPEKVDEHGETQPGLEEFGDPDQPPF